MIFIKTFLDQNKQLVNWLLLLFLGLIWGMAFMGVEMSLKGFQPISIATLRILIAAILLNIIGKIYGYKLPRPSEKNGKKILLHCFGMALFSNVLPFSLLSWAQTQVSSSFAGIAMAIVPLVVLPLSHFFLINFQMTLIKTLGFIIGFFGIIILIGPETLIFKNDNTFLIAQLGCIIASFCYAGGSIITRLTPEVSLISFTSCALLMASILMVPVALIIDGIPNFNNLYSILGVLYLGIFPTALATIILVAIIRRAGPPFLSLVNYQVPIWAVLIGFFILQENLPSRFLLALFIILLGLGISQINYKIQNN